MDRPKLTLHLLLRCQPRVGCLSRGFLRLDMPNLRGLQSAGAGEERAPIHGAA
jgi:hypothetical protein